MADKIICDSCGGEVLPGKFMTALYHKSDMSDDNDVEVTVEHADIRDCIRELRVQLFKRLNNGNRE